MSEGTQLGFWGDEVTIIMRTEYLAAIVIARQRGAHLLEPNAMRRAAVRIGPRIDRICHYAIDSLVDRQFPYDLATLWTVCGVWQRDALLTQPTVNLSNALELSKYLEHQHDGLLYALIRLLLNLVLMRNLAIADGDGSKQFSRFALSILASLTR
jgi:hypothetical protein